MPVRSAPTAVPPSHRAGTQTSRPGRPARASGSLSSPASVQREVDAAGGDLRLADGLDDSGAAVRGVTRREPAPLRGRAGLRVDDDQAVFELEPFHETEELVARLLADRLDDRVGGDEELAAGNLLGPAPPARVALAELRPSALDGL